MKKILFALTLLSLITSYSQVISGGDRMKLPLLPTATDNVKSLYQSYKEYVENNKTELDKVKDFYQPTDNQTDYFIEQVGTETNRELAKFLIECGLPVNRKTRSLDKGMLCYAIQGNKKIHDKDNGKKRLDFIDFLISNGADVHKKTDHNLLNIPIIQAIFSDLPLDQIRSILDLLIKQGADINIKVRLGFTPLHLAVSRLNTSIIELLLNYDNIELDNKNDDGWTPLILTTIWDGLHTHTPHQNQQPIHDIAKALLTKGANLYEKDNLNKTAYDYVKHSNSMIRNYLEAIIQKNNDNPINQSII